MRKPKIIDSPTNILHTGMQSSSRLSQKARAMLKKQLCVIERELGNKSLQPGYRGELLATLLEVMQALDKSTTEAAKLLRGTTPTSTDAPSTDDVLVELTKGQVKRG